MAELIPQPDYQQPELPRHRVTLLLGTLGLASLRPETMDALPWEADLSGMLGDDELRISADELTDNYYVDWITSSYTPELRC